MENLPRDFKGIWIPREIWLHTELSMNEKVLWAEINSLDTPEKGCTASNEYFQNFFGWPERTLRSYLARLKALGFIKQTEFDGRQRVLRSCLKTSQAIFDRSDRQPIAGLGGSPLPVSKPGHIVLENKEEINNIARDLPEKVRMTPEQRRKLEAELGPEKTEAWIQKLSDYKMAKGATYKSDYHAIRMWISKEKESVQPPGSSAKATNEQLLAKVRKKFPRHADIEYGNDYIDFKCFGAMGYLKTTDSGFEERVLNNLAKMNLRL